VKKQFVRELAIDDEVDTVFKVVSYHVKDTRSGQRYLTLGLVDRTGRISGKRWDIGDAEVEMGRSLKYVRVQGVVEDYRGARQVRLDQPIEDVGDDFEPGDYEPTSALKVEELRARLDAIIDGVTERPLVNLLNAFFGDPKFRARFDIAPAAKGIHHACRHGLLQHTVEVAEIVRAICQVQQTWGYPGVSVDLAVTGALLHDIGKIRELDWTEPAYEYTSTGSLLGHITIGYQMVFTKINHVSGFPTPLRDALLHIILSHHGKLEHGSPVTPMLREAQIVTMADDLDARLYCMTEAAEGSDDKDFGWHRGVAGGRVYAGSLGLESEVVEVEDAAVVVEEMVVVEPVVEAQVTPSAPVRGRVDSGAAAILGTISGGQGRFGRR